MDAGQRLGAGSTGIEQMNGDSAGETWSLPADVATERVDADAWEDLYVVGDVHGCIEELRELLDVLDPSGDDLVVFVGDLVRKGPESEAVVELVRSNPNMRTVRGNNERKLLEGEHTEGLPAGQLAYLQSLPAALAWDDALVVHAGIDPQRPLARQTTETLLTMRSMPPENGYAGPFWFERYAGTPRVFFGHTVLDEPVVTEHTVGLDTGCVYGGSLTAYDYRRDEVMSVPAHREYQPRADRKIVEPE